MENNLKCPKDGLKILLGVNQNDEIDVSGEFVYQPLEINNEQGSSCDGSHCSRSSLSGWWRSRLKQPHAPRAGRASVLGLAVRRGLERLARDRLLEDRTGKVVTIARPSPREGRPAGPRLADRRTPRVHRRPSAL